MNCIRTFDSIVGRKEDENVIRELTYELCISYGLYKENTKSNELVGVDCVQWLIWSAELPSLSWIMKYEKWGVCWTKNNKNWVTQVQVMPSWTLMYLSWPLTFINCFKVYWIRVKPIKWTHCHLKPSYASMAFHLSVTYLTFICFTTHLVNFIDLVEIILNYSSYIQCLIIRFLSKL